ncbi:MAG: MFS transporter [Candidatus Korarchaeota archaeon]|nr:MFS transporter [Candidatus Korarchaeota archaeon]
MSWLIVTLFYTAWYIMPSMESQMLTYYKITPEEYTRIFFSPYLLAGIFAIPGGMLGDRYGFRVVCSIATYLAGILLVLRTFVHGFLHLFTLVALTGISLGFLVANLPKLVSLWFPPEEYGLASGIYVSGMAIGPAVGLGLGGLFSSWNIASLLIGGTVLGSATIWTILGKMPSPAEELSKDTLVEGMKKAIRSRSIWGTAIGSSAWLAGLVTLLALLPSGLQSVYGIPKSNAGILASLISGSGIIGNFIFPMLSDRIGRVNPVVTLCAIGGAFAIFLGWMFASTFYIWIFLIIGGMLEGGVPPLLLEVPAAIPYLENPDYSVESVAGASGLVISFFNASVFFLPSFIIVPLFYPHFTLIFFVACLLLSLPAITQLMIREIGVKAPSVPASSE